MTMVVSVMSMASVSFCTLSGPNALCVGYRKEERYVWATSMLGLSRLLCQRRT